MSIVYTVNQMNFFWNYIEDEDKIYLIVIKYYVGTDMFGLRSNLISKLRPINPFSIENGITKHKICAKVAWVEQIQTYVAKQNKYDPTGQYVAMKG